MAGERGADAVMVPFHVPSEALPGLFAGIRGLANLGGIAITQFCLLFTHHVLGLTSPLADNVAAYVVGFGLGTAFRFVFYHYVVFTGHKDRSPDDDDTDSTIPQGQAGSGAEPAVSVSVRP